MWPLLMLCALVAQEEPQQEETKKQEEKQVVVVGKRRESEVLEVASGVSVITREQIEQSGAADIKEVLRRVPGFFPQSSHKGAYDAVIDIRGYNNGGGNGQRTLVLVDGMRTNSPVSSATDWAAIPLDNIERIEIVRGPAATLYGSPALAGAINIVTRKGEGGHKWRTHLSGGSFDTLKGAASASGEYEKLSYFAFVSSELTEGWRDNSRYEGIDTSMKLHYPVAEDWEAYLKVSAHEDDRERPGSLSAAEIASLGRDGSVKPGDDSDRTQLDANAVVTHFNETCGEFTAQVTGLSARQNSRMSFSVGPPFLIHDEFEQSAAYLKHVYELELLDLTWTLTTGVDLLYEEADTRTQGSLGIAETNYVRRMIGLWEHIEVRPVEDLILTGGVRYDRALLGLDRDDPSAFGYDFDVTKDFDYWSPMAGATYILFDEVSLYAAYGRPFKYPVRDELLGFSSADPQLVPESAHSYETGVRFQVEGWGNASVSYYRMDVKNEIFFDPTVGFFGSNINFDKVRHQGVETEARVTPLPEDWPVGLELFGAYTYTRAVIRSNGLKGKRYPVTPFHMGNVGGTVRFEGAFVTLEGRVVGRRYLVSDYTNSSDMLGSYAVMDAKAGYQWDNVRLFLSVFNVFDREYHENGGLDFLLTERFNPGPERSALVGMEAEF